MFSPAHAGVSTPDTLVLGCTHFPMLAGAIRHAIGPDVQIVDSAQTTAASVDVQLRKAGLARTAGGAGTVHLLATDGRERFARVGSRFLKRSISPDEVELVDL
jgi:glutamate racemase